MFKKVTKEEINKGKIYYSLSATVKDILCERIEPYDVALCISGTAINLNSEQAIKDWASKEWSLRNFRPEAVFEVVSELDIIQPRTDCNADPYVGISGKQDIEMIQCKYDTDPNRNAWMLEVFESECFE